MKTSTITIRLDDALERELDQACARTGRTRSDLARHALRRQLALLRFERVRRRVLPLAESQGCLTDDDVFRDVSCVTGYAAVLKRGKRKPLPILSPRGLWELLRGPGLA
jgi:hypothetical protein